MEPGTSKQGADLEPIVSPCGQFYRSATIIGQGGAKIVYEGYNLKRNRRHSVAWCEVLKPDHAHRKALQEESNILKELKHPNIVSHIAFWDSNSNIKDNTVLITELMELGSLKSYRNNFTSINKRTYTRWGCQIIKGIDYLHTRNPAIIHRDIKCANILVSGLPEKLKICDFGLAKKKDLKPKNSVSGTPNFMAPEIYSGKYDEFVDIYSYGLCLLEMITGVIPYRECPTWKQIKEKVLNGEKPIILSEIRDRNIRELIEWCIDFRPMLRPTSLQIINRMFHDKMGPFKGFNELLEPPPQQSLTNQSTSKKVKKRPSNVEAESDGVAEKSQQKLTAPKERPEK